MNKKIRIIVALLFVGGALFLFLLFTFRPTSIVEYMGNIYYPTDATIDPANPNSPQYSHTVNMPLNDPVGCRNFCGPTSQCLITREQCTSDVDCQGCNPGPVKQTTCMTAEVAPYDAAGKLGQNLGLQYSPLTTGYNQHNADFAEAYPGSKDTYVKRAYAGLDTWTDAFNQGLEMYNAKRRSADKYSAGVSNAIPLVDSNEQPINGLANEPNYPMSISSTGLFYETTPPAANARETKVKGK